jgi:c-di-AMP phosphodiesterase-like protein
MQRVLRYLELILTAAGVLIVTIVFLLFHRIAPWKAAALCAVTVAVLHGLIFFAVRSAQRRARNEAIDRVRRQLDDLVRNKLQVVLCATELNGEDWRPVAQFAIQEIGESLDRIEMEAVSAATYR